MVPASTVFAQELDAPLEFYQNATTDYASKHPNMNGMLAEIYETTLAGKDIQHLTSDTSTFGATIDDNQMIQVVLEMIDEDASFPPNLGINEEIRYENLVQARVPITNLAAIAADENVWFVTLPSRPTILDNSIEPLGSSTIKVDDNDKTDEFNPMYIGIIVVIPIVLAFIIFTVKRRVLYN